MSPLWGITDMEGVRPDHRSATTPHVFLHSHSACAAGDVLRQDATVLRYAPRPIRTKRAQQSAPFSGRTLDVLAPLHVECPSDLRGTRDSLPSLHHIVRSAQVTTSGAARLSVGECWASVNSVQMESNCALLSPEQRKAIAQKAAPSCTTA